MKLKPGSRLRSTVCSTEVIVVRAPTVDIEVTCGGHLMDDVAAVDSVSGSVSPEFAEGSQLGRRYADEEIGIEILCTKPGEGSLAVDGKLLLIKGAKPLPSSD